MVEDARRGLKRCTFDIPESKLVTGESKWLRTPVGD